MKRFMSVILAGVLVIAVGTSLMTGTLASFLDTEVSTDNYMHAGTRTIELSGGPIEVTPAIPSHWYSEEFTLVNTGTLDGEVTLHIPGEDGSLDYNGSVSWNGIKNEEAGAIDGFVYDGADYVVGSPVGAGVASSESEFVAEEGGQVGQITVTGLGTDAGSDDGPDAYLMSRYIDVKIWFDKDGDGIFESPDNGEGEDELIRQDKLFNLVSNDIPLGVIPAGGEDNGRGGGWASYFQYVISDGPLEVPLMAGLGQGLTRVGTLTVYNDATNLYVTYDTSAKPWFMDETALYVGEAQPLKLAPGQFPYKNENVGGATHDEYTIPLADINGNDGVEDGDTVYIAAHAAGIDEETAWALGVSRKFKIELHLQQVEDPDWPVDYDGDGDIDDDDTQKRWWPTNVFQGDKCIFDMVFWFKKP